MTLCITEKPSVAADIAQILGAKTKRDGFWEGNGYNITWTFGHLCELKEPNDYTDAWKRWSLTALPMIPERFSIKLKKDKGIEHQFNVIRSLVGQATEVINCGDAGQEGELIQRWVLQLAECRVPVKRLWISSLTDDAIRQGFAQLQPESDFRNLYMAGLSRAAGDWLLGMNATRLYSLKYSQSGAVLSIGRVQTPTLALIVKRQQEIRNFVPEDFWELKTIYREATFSATQGRYMKEADAQAALEEIRTAPFTITSVQQKAGREAPPRLFDLTSLQVECNKRWGWTADRTLQLIQALYEKKVTTYPRVDTTYLPDDVYPKVPDILRRMTPYAPQTAPLLAADYRLPKTKKVFDNSKVTDHHAIIPTGESPSFLVGDEKLMYHLIALRFIGAFYPDCEFQTTTVLGKAARVEFKATGKVITRPGWRELHGAASDDNKDEEEAILPAFTQGESGPHEPALQKKQTQPPKPYTEGTLLRAMESAGKTVDDEELREAMKENGIGRPSTRASIIETLFRRRYIERERKNIVATAAGEELIGLIHEELLKSAKLTGLWENKLRRIERGDFSPLEFMNELKVLITEIVRTVIADPVNRRIVIEEAKTQPKAAPKTKEKAPAKPRAPRLKSVEELPCPICGQGHLLRGRTAYGCSRFREGCALRLPFEQYAADLTPAKLRKLLEKNFPPHP